MEASIDRDLLFVLAEIAVAVTGFSGIAAAIGRPKTELERWHVRSVVEAGAWCVVMSLLPAFIDRTGLGTEAVWRASSAVLVVVIVGYYLVNRGAVKTVFEGMWVRTVAIGDALALILSVANTAGFTGRFIEAGYLYVLYWFLIQALVFFFLAIRDIWTNQASPPSGDQPAP